MLIRSAKDCIIFSNRLIGDHFSSKSNYEILSDGIVNSFHTITDLSLDYALSILDSDNKSFSRFSNSVLEQTSYARLFACLLVLHINKCELDQDNKDFIACLFSDSLLHILEKDKLNLSSSASHQLYGWHILSHCIDALSFLSIRPSCNDLEVKPDVLLDKIEQQVNTIINSSKILTHVSTSNQLFHYLHLHSFIQSIFLNKDFELSEFAQFSLSKISAALSFPFSLFSKIKRNRSVRYFYHLAILDPKIAYQICYSHDTLLSDFSSKTGFGAYTTSDPCDDIDYIFMILALNAKTNHSNDLCKIYQYISELFCLDGSFLVSQDKSFSYQGDLNLSSRINEGNIWSTWFRYLSMSYLVKNLGLNTHCKFLHSPGYHIAL